MIKLKEINKTYKNGKNDYLVLNNINLTINKGDFISIHGSSGSGKSTLLNILGLLDEASSGCYNLNDKDVSSISFNEMAAIRNEKIGVVFQSYNLIDELNVYENIALPYLYSSKKKDHNNILNLLSLVDLTDKEQFYPSQLSGGQQQRVAIARAMVMEPDILLLDEPTGNLDKKNSDIIMDFIQDFHSKGNAVCLITHETQYAMRAIYQYEMSDGILRVVN